MKKIRKNAFTLAETLITVVILGIVAAIVVPNLINRQVENANRTRVKKAMASYEKAINYIIIENDIRTTEGIREFGQDDDCESAKKYFKTVQDGANDCIFRTADRVWWDITDLSNPLIILKDSQKDKTKTELQTLAKDVNNKTIFSMVGRFDDLGTLRVNDNGFEQSQANNINNRKYMAKLWGFVNNTVIELLSEFVICNANRLTTCTITSANGQEVTYTKITTNTDTTVDKISNGNKLCRYNRETNKNECRYVSIALAGEYWISDNLGKPTAEEAKDMAESVCTLENCLNSGDYYEAAKRKCQSSGGHLATLAELSIARANGKMASGWFWASEESGSNNSYNMYSNGVLDNGYYKSIQNGQVICVGN